MVAGNSADLAFAFQGGKGSVATASTQRLYLAGGTQVHAEIVDAPYVETTGLRMRSDRYRASAHAAGAPDFYVMPKSGGALIYAVLGSKSVTGSGDPYTHVFTAAASTPWLTVWRTLSNLIYERFTDCKVTQLVIHGQSEQPLTVTATVMGLTPGFKTAAETTATAEITNRFMHYDGSGAFLIEGVAAASLRDFTITINNTSTLEPGDSLTSNSIEEGLLEVTVTATTLFTAASVYNRINYGNTSPSANDPIKGAVLELAGSPAGLDFKFTRIAASRTLEIAIPRVTVDPFQVTFNTSGQPLTAVLTYHALQPADLSSPITATVLNSQTSY